MLILQEAGLREYQPGVPQHVIAQVLEALVPAAEGGLRLPLVYNTGGYDARRRPGPSRRRGGHLPAGHEVRGQARGSPPVRRGGLRRRNREAVREMHRQVGDLQLDAGGLARRGLLVRHLVLPGRSGRDARGAEFLAREVSLDTYANVMDQ